MADRRFNLQKVICFEFMGEMRAMGIFCSFKVVSTSDDISVFPSKLLLKLSILLMPTLELAFGFSMHT